MRSLTAINASPAALERPVCRGWVGDYQITGKHCHVLPDGAGYLLYVTGTVQRWKRAKRSSPSCVTIPGNERGVPRPSRLTQRSVALGNHKIPTAKRVARMQHSAFFRRGPLP